MKPNTVLECLNILYDANVPGMLWSDTGLAKSALVKQLAKERGAKIVDLRLATQEPGDIIGMPGVDPETGFTVWARPSWWDWEEEQEGVLFLDEINRAPKEVRQAVFQVLTERHLHTHVLPKNVRIFGACNPPDGDYLTETLDPALNARWCHLKVTPDAEQWIENCSKFIHPDVLGYIAASPSQICDMDTQFQIDTLTRKNYRTWEFVSLIVKSMEGTLDTPEGKAILRPLLSGCIGSAAAQDYIRSMGQAWTTIAQIFSGKKTYSDVRADLNDLRRLCVFLPLTAKMEDIAGPDGTENKASMENLINFMNALLDDKEDLAVAVIKKLSRSEIKVPVRRAITRSKPLFAAMKRIQSLE